MPVQHFKHARNCNLQASPSMQSNRNGWHRGINACPVIIWVHWAVLWSMLEHAVEEEILQTKQMIWLEIWMLSPRLQLQQQNLRCPRSFSSIVAGGVALVLCYPYSPESLGHRYQAIVRISDAYPMVPKKVNQEHNIETETRLPGYP